MIQDILKEIAGKQYINGAYMTSKGAPFDVYNPSTEQLIAKGTSATQSEVDLAVQSASKAFVGEWRNMDPFSRGQLMHKLANLIEENLNELAYLETLNSGKPLKVTKNEDLPYTAYIYKYYAGQTDKIKGSTLAMSKPFFGLTKKQPIGVVAQIIPWNYPLLMMAWKVAPALAAGCTIILKPAEQTPFSALYLGKLFTKAGFPAGVINIITGKGETGAYLCQHKLINKISFTGSTEVGYHIMRNSHKLNLKPITLELGGKSALVVCPDVDLSTASDTACIMFSNCGQSCISSTRVFAHESIYDQFVSLCVQRAKNIKVGDPLNQNYGQGPICNRQQFQKVLYYISEGKREGAIVAVGGKRVGQKGFFVEPTIFKNVKDEMKIAKEEIFGPVMSILKWSDEEDVIKRANSLPYGLGAGVITKNIDKALKFTQKLNAGTVYVNCFDYQQACTPFGGVKDSGIGKDLGDEGLESYLVTKTIIMKPNL